MFVPTTQISLIFSCLVGLVGVAAASSSHLRGGRSLQGGSPVTTNYNVIEDVFVREDAPTRNYDHTTNLAVAYGDASSNRTAYVKFPIEFEVRNSVSIDSATVYMRVNNQAPTETLTINVFPCDTESWVEDLITWDFRPTYDTASPVTSFTLAPTDANSWMAIDVTTQIVAAAQEPGRTSLSLVLEAQIPGDLVPASQIMKFDSKEDGTHIPYLQVTYVEGDATNAPSDAPSSSPTIEYSQPEYPQLVSVGTDGSLEYVPYANEINLARGSTANPAAVNKVPDFSGAGYKGGGVPIPFLPVQQTLYPANGDRRQDIQDAIDAVAALPIDANGFRGAVLLKAGQYNVSHPGLHVYDSGIVIRGEGQSETGTTILYTSTIADDAITLGFTNGKYENMEPNGVTYSVTDSFVPVGTNSLNITDASALSPGDDIVVQLTPNDDWLLHMSNMEQWGWTPTAYQVQWVRKVVAVDGNQLTLDHPIVQAIESVYGGAHVYRYELLYNSNQVEIENVGVENIRIDSIYASELDENHGDHAVVVQRVRNGWIRQLTARYFWRGAVKLRRQSYGITVEDSAALDPKGSLAGGRRYPFVIDDGQLHLFQRCYAKDFRHTFASSSQTPGPNVWVDGSAVESYNDVGPHERFSTGQLYDNIRTDINPLDDNDNGGEMNVQNRGPSGSGHGWAGVQIMFWNSEATRWRVHAANGAMSWAIGMKGQLGDRFTREPEPDGIFQSLGSFVTPRSLYYAQLQDRMGPNALHSVVLPNQRAGVIWDELDAWMGDGLFGDAVVAWFDEEAGPISVDTPLDIGGMVRDLNLLGNSPSYAWTVSTGPTSATFGDSSSVETTVTFDTPGTYTLSLTVNDGTVSEVASIQLSVEGTSVPSASPTASPSAVPTANPTASPTLAPVTQAPSTGPTFNPTTPPSVPPSSGPSKSPSAEPTTFPTTLPTAGPTLAPVTQAPSVVPSFNPSSSPTTLPTAGPTLAPVTQAPSVGPSFNPSGSPTTLPTAGPTLAPVTQAPSVGPSFNPSGSPTVLPTAGPTLAPVTQAPSAGPSFNPSGSPTILPTEPPSGNPTASPTVSPTTHSPTRQPTSNPTVSPTTSFSCGIYSKAKSCKDDSRCNWEKGTCVDKN